MKVNKPKNDSPQKNYNSNKMSPRKIDIKPTNSSKALQLASQRKLSDMSKPEKTCNNL